MNTTINREYDILHKKLGFTLPELEQITLNAVAGSFLPAPEKKKLTTLVKKGYRV